MDALRAKNLSCYGYERPTSPNIDKLAKSGALFKNAFSTNNSTNPSFLSIHSGRHLLKKDLSTFIYNEQEIKSFFDSGGVFLQEILKSKGYKTYCLNNLYTWQKNGFDYFWGIEQATTKNLNKKRGKLFQLAKKTYYGVSSIKALSFLIKNKIRREVRPFARAEKATQDAIRIIEEHKENRTPFFMRIDFDDTHMPYNDFGEFKNKFRAHDKGELFFKNIGKKNLNKRLLTISRMFFEKNSGINDIIAKYDSAIAYNDYQIGKVLKKLEENKMINNTYIFFFSDHGESFSEHGIYINHIGLYDNVLNVPLIVSGPKIPKNKNISSIVQLGDIVPTILDLLEIKHNPENFDGKSLRALMLGKTKQIRESLFIEEIFDLKRRGLRTRTHKYIETNFLNGNKKKELYDLSKDPEELNDISSENKNLLIELERQMNLHIKNLQKENEKRRIKRSLAKLQQSL